MSIVCNMVGGASGGGGLVSSEAVIAVYVDVGTSVEMTKGGITLTPVMWQSSADAAQYTAIFTIQSSMFDSGNAWTITATDGIETETATQIIDSNEYYEIWLRFWHGQIYTNGNQWTRVTGGFDTIKGYPSGSYTLSTISYGSPPDGVITISNTQNHTSCAITLNAVDVTDYNYLNVKLETNNHPVNRLFMGVRTTNTSVDITTNAGFSAKMAIPASATGVQSLSIGSVAGNQYILIGAYNGGSTTYICEISEWWMSVNPPT